MLDGLGALGFWLFIASIVVAGMWFGVRSREARHETLRSLIASGQPVDEGLVRRLLHEGGAGGMGRGLMACGLITLFAAAGVAIFAVLLSFSVSGWLFPLLGAAALTACVAIGCMAAAAAAGGWTGKEIGEASKTD